MKHLPWLLLAAVLAYPLLAQSSLGRVSNLRGPVKVLGIAAPDEWVDIESNEVGQPPTRYTVTDGHRLTLVSAFSTPGGVDSVDTDKQIFDVLLDGVSASPVGGLLTASGKPADAVLA